MEKMDKAGHTQLVVGLIIEELAKEASLPIIPEKLKRATKSLLKKLG